MLRAVFVCVAIAAFVSACSVGLADNVDDYVRAHGAAASTHADAGQQPMSGSALACAPNLDPDSGLAVVRETWRPPSSLHQGRCTVAQAQTLADCEMTDPLSRTKRCADFLSTAANMDCAACAVTATTASTWGPLLQDGSDPQPQINVAGCVAALSGDTSLEGCGPKLVARVDCESVVCNSCSDVQAYACMQAAGKGVCADRVAAASCADAVMPSCTTGQSMVADALLLVQLFCGQSS